MPRSAPLCLLLAALALPAFCEGHNPPAEGFDLAGSDPKAIEIADAVMEKMGGREAWDATRFLTWKFFDRRLHVWDKWTGDLRVEGTDRESGQEYTILMNLHTGEGRAFRDGAEVTDPEELEKMLDSGEAAWINDGYWMFMPYKLKDSGVTLGYLGEGAMADGRAADVLELTFEGVGRTPQNKYHVYVARDSGLVEQWDFYSDAGDAEPRFQIPWRGWTRHGGILLSADRGETGHTGIAVFEELPASVFSSPEPIDWEALGR
ncbi:MAG: hypothetical protein R3325_07450 [Thermoanaerobaculia bacterium]|nr:hypothetical protein [Thermoanaerobaculia bacterium]